jgi:geranylgeranyl transferase type-2 subunit beta
MLVDFILKCQDVDDGGIADRPGILDYRQLEICTSCYSRWIGNVADPFHTFFGVSGLSLLGYFEDKAEYKHYRSIDPTYALPSDLVKELGLPSQLLPQA